MQQAGSSLIGTLAVSQYCTVLSEVLRHCKARYYSLTLNAWENILCHDCGLHIAHVHKNPCGSRDFPNQALFFLNCTPISLFAASLFFCYLLFMDEQWQQQEKVRPGNEATLPQLYTMKALRVLMPRWRHEAIPHEASLLALLALVACIVQKMERSIVIVAKKSHKWACPSNKSNSCC